MADLRVHNASWCSIGLSQLIQLWIIYNILIVSIHLRKKRKLYEQKSFPSGGSFPSVCRLWTRSSACFSVGVLSRLLYSAVWISFWPVLTWISLVPSGLTCMMVPSVRTLSSLPSGYRVFTVWSGKVISLWPSGKCFSVWLLENCRISMPSG